MSTSTAVNWLAGAATPVRGELTVPGDKSISHRAIMLAALADGVSQIDGFLEGADTRATAAIFAQLGVRIDAPSAQQRIVHGVGLDGLRGSDAPLDCGNAGTAMRLMAGLLSGQSFTSTLIGDSSLSKRPMGRVIEPLQRMGADIAAAEGLLPPLIISVSNKLQGIDYSTPIASAQVKSAVLLAGLYAHGETRVREPHPTRDYTERMLSAFGWPISFQPGEAVLTGGHRLRATDVQVPADFSSAAFFILAATLIPGSDLLLRRVGCNPRRTGFLTALRLMGADISEQNPGNYGGEAVFDLRVRSAALLGIDLPEALVPDMIDEFPALFVAAALARGQTRVRGASELRVKESDRIAVMATALRRMGAEITETPDGAIITGGELHGGEVESGGDHRIAMALAVAAQLSRGAVQIADCANVATSFPGFMESAVAVGMGLKLA